ncbi:short coiled-coil protein isoform X3 [Balaenoptera acutorostrata]|uniref:Short coiled-coil protein isoform X3 n=1 Tax=Balaenoptera acutorostrata TaxID=9767 RepID=A0ABM3TJT7_BALAC|nr:short coiled-coil protein isoform X3 [Balaenoptera acutorostrata]
MDGSSQEEEEDRTFTNISLADDTDHSSRILYPRPKSLLPKMMNADMDAVDAENQVELEEKTRLINQVLELQHTLEGPCLSFMEATLKPTENKTALGLRHPGITAGLGPFDCFNAWKRSLNRPSPSTSHISKIKLF